MSVLSSPIAQPAPSDASGGQLAELHAALRQAQEEAASVRQQLTALTDHLREGLLLFSPSRQVMLVNDQFCELFCLKQPASYWVNQSLEALSIQVRECTADPGLYDQEVNELVTYLTTNEHVQSQLKLRDGRVLEREVLRVSLGDEYGWLFTYRDISARLTAERERERQRLFYETVLDELPVEVAVLDENFRYVYANKQAEPDAERLAWLLDGHTVHEFCARYGFPLELAAHRERMFRQAQQRDEPIFWDDHTPRPDGGWVHQRQFKRLGQLGQPDLPYMLGAGLDVTARVRAEERSQRSEAALREQQEFMEQVFDTTPNAIFVRDEAGRLLFSNFMMAELMTQLQRPGTQVAAGHSWQPATDAPVLTQGHELITEDTVLLADGTERWFHTVRRLLERPDGSRQVLGVSTDITDLKAAQLAAEAAAQARENFLANMSHEIRTPMNGVLGIAGLLAKTSLTAEQQDYLRTIRSSGNHLLSLLNDVLDIAKINSGKLELEEVPFELLDSVRQAVTPLALQAADKGLTLHFDCPSRAAWVLSDSFRLNQVLINLLSNAIKFTERGNITLRLQIVAELPALRIVRFEVQDSGIGIKPDALARIFESFTQAYADTSRRFGGTGLGLTISRALVAKLGGELSVESTYGEGSTFSFTLPLPVASEPAPGPATDQLAEGLLRGTRMLLAEDNDVNRVVASLHLLQWGVEVDEAVDGPAALKCLEEQTYDAVLMDIQMPGMSGLEVTRHLRRFADIERATTPVLALTANAFRSDNEKYLAAGLNDYLAKPFAEEDLYAKLVHLLRHPASAASPAPRPAAAAATLPVATPTAGRSYSLARLRHEAKGQPIFIQRMLQAFLAATPPRLLELQAAAAAYDWLRVAELAHHLKPNLELLAIVPAHEAALALEVLPGAADELRHVKLVAQLVAAVEETLRELPAELVALEQA